MIAVLIPLAPGHSVHPQVLAALDEQTEPNEVFPYCSPEVLPPRQHEAINRNYLKQFATDYTLLLDDNQVLDNKDTLALLRTYLDTHPNIDAVGCDSKGMGTNDRYLREQKIYHVVMAPCLARGSALDRVTFRQLEPESCLCPAFNMDIGAGRIVYHQTITAKEVRV